MTSLIGRAFGLVVGWVTYRTLRRSRQNGISDLATVIGAVGGASVTAMFPPQSDAFGAYGTGLAAGFFAYLIVSLFVAGRERQSVNEWLGDPFQMRGGSSGQLERNHD